MAASRAHHTDFSQDLPRLSARQWLWLKDGVAGLTFVVFFASVYIVL